MSQVTFTPLDIEQRRSLAIALLHVFDPAYSHKLKGTGSGRITPLTIGDAHKELQKHNIPLPSDPSELYRLAEQLARGGLLVSAGLENKGSPPMHWCYYNLPCLTSREQKGSIWLTKALGWEFLALEVQGLVAMVVGKKANGDKASGSGLILDSRHVITNQHVVGDMEVEKIWAGGSRYSIATARSHQDIDVAVVQTETDMPWVEVGLSFRAPRLIEPILCLGHPPVPKAAVPPSIVAQSGEIVGFVPMAHDGQRYALFSATARPGNSGGPVFGNDGRVIGLVSRSLEEDSRPDGSHLFPFFAAVPSEEVKTALEDMGLADCLPWETYS